MENNILRNWVWFLIGGIVLVILGLLAISAAAITTVISVVFLGCLLFLAGIYFIVDSFRVWGQWSKFSGHLFMGLLYLLAGFWLIIFPVMGAMSLTLLLGLAYLIIGIFRALNAISWKFEHWGWGLTSGIIAALLGFLILIHWPASSLFIIGLFVGIDLLLVGWFYILISLAARKETSTAVK